MKGSHEGRRWDEIALVHQSIGKTLSRFDGRPAGERISRRRFMQGAAAAAVWSFPGARAVAGGRGRGGPADLIVHGGRVLTLDRSIGDAQAIAIRRGKILAVGRDRAIRRLAGGRTELIDAAGGTVLAGINDSHIHVSSFGLAFPPFSFDVDSATIEELVERVSGAVTEVPPGGWIRGRGWNETRLPRAPNRFDLDPVSGDHPVALVDFSLHATAVNTRALELAGITRDTAPPPGGVIEKDADGEPTGVLREGAQELAQAVVPPYTSEENATAIGAAIEVLHAQGVTSATEPGISLELLDLYADLARSGRLPVRLSALLSAGSSPASLEDVLSRRRPLRGVDARGLRVAGIKIFADGVPTAARTAWMHEPYLDGTNGSLTIDGADPVEQVANLHEMIRIADRVGLQLGVHATGDATIDAVVDGYLRVLGRANRRRHYVIHGDFTPRATLRTMGTREIGVNMNAQIKYLIDRLLDPIVGPERTDHHWPYRSALDAGVRVSSGSDAPVTFPDWRQGVMTAMLREGSLGNVAGEKERITFAEAVRTYTSAPAWQDFAERWKGTLAPGRAADVCVLADDLTRVDPRDFPEVPVVATILRRDARLRSRDELGGGHASASPPPARARPRVLPGRRLLLRAQRGDPGRESLIETATRTNAIWSGSVISVIWRGLAVDDMSSLLVNARPRSVKDKRVVVSQG